MDEGGGDLVLERKVGDTCYSMPAGLTLTIPKSHDITMPCHYNLNIILIYKCKKKKRKIPGSWSTGKREKAKAV